jgi:hypothetical protein
MICPFFKRRILMPNLNCQSEAPERATWHTASPVVKTGRLLKFVERALESNEIHETGREPASAFYTRLSEVAGTDVDLEAVITQGRRGSARSLDRFTALP